MTTTSLPARAAAGSSPGRPLRSRVSSLGNTLAGAYAAWVLVLTIACGIGALAAAVFAVGQPRDGLITFTVAVMLGGAAVLCGGLVGFLFALPRSVTVAHVADGHASGQITVRPNTNLEDISDWVTKIVVGLTLVQIGRVPDVLGGLFESAGRALAPGEAAVAFAGGLLVYCALNGAIGGWIGTRLFLGRMMQVSDRPLLAASAQAAADGHPELAEKLAEAASERQARLT